MSAESNGISGRGWASVIGAIVLVGSELMAVSVAAGWALGGLFELGPVLTYLLEGIFFLLSGAGTYIFAKRALHVERIIGPSTYDSPMAPLT